MTNDDRVALDQADALIAEGRTTAASRIVRKIVLARPSNWRAAWTLLAAVHAANPGLAPAGAELLQRLEATVRAGHAPSQKDAVRIGRFLFQHREVQAARAVVDHLIAAAPGDLHASLFKYDVELALAQYDAAFAVIEGLMQARSGEDLTSLRRTYAKGLMKAGRPRQAAAALDAIDEPDGTVRLQVRIAAQIGARAFGDALETGLRLIREFGAVDKLLRGAAQKLAAAGGEREAIALLQAAVAHTPGDAMVWEDLAALLARAGETQAALDANVAAIAIASSARRLYRRGVCELALKRQGDAEASLAALTALAPDAAETQGLKAQVEAARGSDEAAKAAEAQVAAILRRDGTKRIGVGRPSPKILGVIACTSMGDFTYQAMALASIKRQFTSAHLTALYCSDDPFKAVVMGFIPDFDVVEDYAGQPYRVDVIGDAPPKNLIFTPAELSGTLIGRFDRTATMRVPADREARLRGELLAAGADPDRWIMVMHYRQGSTFPHQGVSHRDVSPETFHAMARYVSETLGGQVLRLGHDGMDPIPETPGYVDLSRGSIELQMYATARARFMLGTDSGPCGYAAGFRTPILKSNSFSEEGAFYPTDILMPKNVINWRGEVLDLTDATADRLLEFKSISGYGEMISFADNSFEQLKHGVDLLHAETSDVQGWRMEPPARAEPPCPDALIWPPHRRNSRIMPMSELAGRPLWRVE